MADRSEDLRKEAARCLEAARQSKNPKSVSELVRLAAKFLELADYRPVDLEAILAEYNVRQMVPPKSEGVVQQQRQAQPKPKPKKES